MKTYDYTHPLLNEEIRAVGGHYAFNREIRIPLAGKQVLAFVGYALVDTSCCGVGGCGYALVPGFIEAYGTATTHDGRAVSRVTAVEDSAQQNEVSRLLRASHQVHQINFYSP